MDETPTAGPRSVLRGVWAWYLARGLSTRILIGFVAFVAVLSPFSGEDADPASSAEPRVPTPTVSATVTETAEPEPGMGSGDTDAVSAEADETAGAATTKKAARRSRTFIVSRVIDGDTIELGSGDTVRVVGIDTPERGECGYAEARATMERLVLGKRVRLPVSDEDTDRYGRLLRYVNVGNRDVGLAQIRAGLAIARYDSRDGYGFHPREDRYIAADKARSNKTCPKLEPSPKPAPLTGGGGSVYYENCTAARAAGAAPVRRGDPGYDTHLDRDGDGVGCE